MKSETNPFASTLEDIVDDSLAHVHDDKTGFNVWRPLFWFGVVAGSVAFWLAVGSLVVRFLGSAG